MRDFFKVAVNEHEFALWQRLCVLMELVNKNQFIAAKYGGTKRGSADKAKIGVQYFALSLGQLPYFSFEEDMIFPNNFFQYFGLKEPRARPLPEPSFRQRNNFFLKDKIVEGFQPFQFKERLLQLKIFKNELNIVTVTSSQQR